MAQGRRDLGGRGARLEHLRPGLRAGVAFGLAAIVLGISFGVLARPLMGTVAPIVMSVVVFSGAAQFGATAVLAAGGDAAAAIVAGTLLNARFLPMGVALAPSLTGGAARRAAEGQAIVDASWALAARGGGRLDRNVMLGATIPQYPGWVLGTVIGGLRRWRAQRSRRARTRRDLPRLLPRSDGHGAELAAGPGRGHRRRRYRPAPRAARAAGRAGPRGLGGGADRSAEPVTTVWVTIAGLALTNAAIKAAGPVALGGRELPRPALGVIALLAPALLAALVLTETFTTTEGDLTLDARAVGLAAAAVAVLLRAPLLVTILVAAAATAGARALG